MPLFEISNLTLRPIRAVEFPSERSLQRLVEKNLLPIFNCRFVATEFPTGLRHSGRIDTLALSESGNPVLLEYKRTESATLISQCLFYLSWLDDHHGDFEVAARAALGPKVRIDWNEIRMLCIAPSFTRYDLHAVESIDRGVELWTYHCFENGTLQFRPAALSRRLPRRKKHAQSSWAPREEETRRRP